MTAAKREFDPFFHEDDKDIKKVKSANTSVGGRTWTSDEILELFRAGYSRNTPNMAELAARLDRTPKSVTLKLSRLRKAIEELVAAWAEDKTPVAK